MDQYLILVLISIFLMTNEIKHIFFVLSDHVFIFFGEMCIYILCPFFKLRYPLYIVATFMS